MMNNSAQKATHYLLTNQNTCFHLRSSLFHSTAVLDRKRRTYWDSTQRSNFYRNRSKRLHAKQSLLKNINAYADYILQGWGKNSDDEDEYSSKGPSWFRKHYSKRPRGGQGNGNRDYRHWGSKKPFEFCDDDIEPETILRSAFGGNRFFYWSFIHEENPQWNRSYNYTNNNSRRNRKNHFEEDTSESEGTETDLSADRRALGLSSYGPLKLEDVKTAYRACALKWHPDRHQGSSKALAEEKFKLCSAAYQSLCDKLTAV